MRATSFPSGVVGADPLRPPFPAIGVDTADKLAGRDLGWLLHETLARTEGEQVPPEMPVAAARRESAPRQLGMGW